MLSGRWRMLAAAESANRYTTKTWLKDARLQLYQRPIIGFVCQTLNRMQVEMFLTVTRVHLISYYFS